MIIYCFWWFSHDVGDLVRTIIVDSTVTRFGPMEAAAKMRLVRSFVFRKPHISINSKHFKVIYRIYLIKLVIQLTVKKLYVTFSGSKSGYMLLEPLTVIMAL
jgi:hypothetical protein